MSAEPNLQPAGASVKPFDGVPNNAGDGAAELYRYQKIVDCIRANYIQLLSPKGVGNPTADQKFSSEGKCLNIAPTDIHDRLVHLERAASLGVPGAALLFEAEGPFGEPEALTTRPDDLLVVEWKAKVMRYFDVALEHGDLSALNEIATNNLTAVLVPQNLDKAFMYAVAAQELGQLGPGGMAVLKIMEKFGDSEQKSTAEAAGKALANSLRPR